MNLHLPELPPNISALAREEDIAYVNSISEGRWTNATHCETCGGTGTFRWKIRESVEWRKGVATGSPDDVGDYECPCEDQWVIYRNLLAANLPLAYQRLSIWDLADKAHQEFLIEHLYYLERTVPAGLGLLLQGEPGTGKTLTAALIAKGALALGHTVYYATFADIIDKYAQGWRDPAWRAYFASHAQKANLLVIDDIGKESRQSFKSEISNVARSFISETLRARMQDQAATYLTSNLDLDQIAQGYGTDVGSLLTERMEVRGYHGGDFRSEANSRIRTEVREGLRRPVLL